MTAPRRGPAPVPVVDLDLARGPAAVILRPLARPLGCQQAGPGNQIICMIGGGEGICSFRGHFINIRRANETSGHHKIFTTYDVHFVRGKLSVVLSEGLISMHILFDSQVPD